MKRTVTISLYSTIMSIIGVLILAGLVWYNYRVGKHFLAFYVLTGLAILCICALIYMPLNIQIKDDALWVYRPLWFKKIPISEIKSIELRQPTTAIRKYFSSGGWFGYWGWFTERGIGKYFAYYGKASDCFLVRLKNGRLYMLGCKDPQSIVDHISDRIK